MHRFGNRLVQAIEGVTYSAITVLFIQFLLLAFIPDWVVVFGIILFSIYWWYEELEEIRESNSISDLAISITVLVLDVYLFTILP